MILEKATLCSRVQIPLKWVVESWQESPSSSLNSLLQRRWIASVVLQKKTRNSLRLSGEDSSVRLSGGQMSEQDYHPARWSVSSFFAYLSGRNKVNTSISALSLHSLFNRAREEGYRCSSTMSQYYKTCRRQATRFIRPRSFCFTRFVLYCVQTTYTLKWMATGAFSLVEPNSGRMKRLHRRWKRTLSSGGWLCD